jgi:hypothetical protein
MCYYGIIAKGENDDQELESFGVCRP